MADRGGMQQGRTKGKGARCSVWLRRRFECRAGVKSEFRCILGGNLRQNLLAAHVTANHRKNKSRSTLNTEKRKREVSGVNQSNRHAQVVHSRRPLVAQPATTATTSPRTHAAESHSPFLPSRSRASPAGSYPTASGPPERGRSSSSTPLSSFLPPCRRRGGEGHRCRSR